MALSRLALPDREVRRTAAEAVTAALAPGLRTRAYVLNTLLADKSVDDRLRRYPNWLAARNLANEASDESVQALIEAVRGRYELARRWYRLKAGLLGIDRLADYDRMAAVTQDEVNFTYTQARELVLDCYGSFSPELGELAGRFFAERWIDAPVRPAKRGGAFCASAVPSAHPYVLLNYTARRRDVLTLAHELGHGVHFALAARQGIFHQGTPLTLAETASVFGETVVFGRLLAQDTTPQSRLALLAEHLEDIIATVFRQVAMNRFEELAHTGRREQGELSVERIGELWAQSQAELLGDSVEITDGYRTWWSYIPHFINTPGYVYAYAYGQLLALSVYERYEQQGADFVPHYLELLAAGGSRSPEELGEIVGVDLTDPGFWDAGLDLVERQLELAEAAAAAHRPKHGWPTAPIDRVIARALLAFTVTLTLAAAAAPSRRRRAAVELHGAGRTGDRTERGWRSGDWYCEYLRCTGEYPLLTIWGDVRMFESVDALELAAPSPAHRAQVDRFGHASERYWNTYLNGYAPYPGDRYRGAEAWFDDNGWLGVAFVDAYKATGERRYLRDAQRAFNFAATQGWDAAGGGGMWWNTDHPYHAGEALASNSLLGMLLYGIDHSPSSSTRCGSSSTGATATTSASTAST